MESEFRVYKHPGRDNAWFIADSVSGTVVLDGCTSLDAAIKARQRLVAGVQSEAEDEPTEIKRLLRFLDN